MSDRSGCWGSEGQGSSRSKKEAEDRRLQQEADRQHFGAAKAREDETFKRPHKAFHYEGHYSDYAATPRLMYEQYASKTEAMREKPVGKVVYAAEDATSAERARKRNARSDVRMTREPMTQSQLRSHKLERQMFTETNAAKMREAASHGVQIRDFAYPTGHPAHYSFQDPRRSLSPSPEPGRRRSPTEDESYPSKGKGKAREW